MTGAYLSIANLTGVYLFRANLTGADLRGNTKNLTQEQLDKACGNADTKLPRGLQAVRELCDSGRPEPLKMAIGDRKSSEAHALPDRSSALEEHVCEPQPLR